LLDDTHEQFLIPSAVVIETCWMLGRWVSADSEVTFLRGLDDPGLSVEPLGRRDYPRVADLVDRYRDLSIGAVDASIVATAERLNITKIATLDRRHFSIVRPRHITHFELLP
jgi:predicted nucleic acid-binding protein